MSRSTSSRSMLRMCWRTCPTAKTSTRCSRIRMFHSEVSDMDNLDLSTVGQHLGSRRVTVSDATRLTETRDEEAGQGEGNAEEWRVDGGILHRKRRVLKAAVTPAERSMTNRPRCHVSSLPRSTCADPREIDKCIWTSSHNSDELVSADVRPSFIGSRRRRIKINALSLSLLFDVAFLDSFSLRI